MVGLRADLDRECYWRRDLPTSPGRVLLIRALGRLCALRHEHALPIVALTFDEEGSIFVEEPARSQILKAARSLGQAFAAGTVRTYAREFGGSAPLPLPLSVWELDEFDLRFTTSALDPLSPFDPTSTPTHWIFVDEAGLDRFLTLATDVVASPNDAQGKPADDMPGSDRVTGVGRVDRLVRMPELRTRTGLSRATIYRRIAASRFPKPVPMDGNIAAWRDSDVAEWVANPR